MGLLRQITRTPDRLRFGIWPRTHYGYGVNFAASCKLGLQEK